MARRTILPLLLCAATAGRVAADNLSCNGTGMDWYINMVGETPCQTYQSLRQICNSNYRVGVQNVNTPPDGCTDQVSECCCNTIAFSLSMLCLNCQQDIGTGNGFDAGVGAYDDYLGSCSNPESFKLPTDIQTAVCNENLKIDDYIYSNGWSNGAWFYIFTSETMQKDNIVANNNSFTHCASTTLNTTSAPGSSVSPTSTTKSSLSSSSAQTSSSSSASANLPIITTKTLAPGAIAGIAVGALIIALAVAAALWWFCHDRKRHARDMRGSEEQIGADGMWERPWDGRGGTKGGLGPRAYAYTSSGSPATTSDHIDTTVSGGQSSTRSDGSQVNARGNANAGWGRRLQAGPLPRKWSRSASPRGAQVLRVPRRRDSEGPFLEERRTEGRTPDSERHRDGGPISVSLGRSPSGRLPPAYGDQIQLPT
ncbi:hypothetical protein C8R45DRAFT_1100574 [Mycena sanguinolenta]|nr:hypothetical protein C8R45DRAFT_1100574 [Mycena sanguinolenta]